MRIYQFEELDVWQKSRAMVLKVYNVFNQHKDFAFRDQIQRASVSVMNNIAEGFERQTNNELIRFLYISKGSAGEVRSMLYLAKDLDKINNDDFKAIYDMSNEISKMLSGLIKSLKRIDDEKK